MAGANLGRLWRAAWPEGTELGQDWRGRHSALSRRETFAQLGKRMNVQIVPPAIRALQGKISQAYVGVNADYMEATTRPRALCDCVALQSQEMLHQ